MMNCWAFGRTCLITTSFFLTMTSGGAFAHSPIWSKNSGMGLGPAAAIFAISGGSTSVTSDSTTINYFTDGNCGVLQSTTPTGGSYTFNNPSQVQANGVSIYNINPSPSISSIQVIPTNGGTNVFTTTPCFAVTCSPGLGSCVYSGAAKTVALS